MILRLTQLYYTGNYNIHELLRSISPYLGRIVIIIKKYKNIYEALVKVLQL